MLADQLRMSWLNFTARWWRKYEKLHCTSSMANWLWIAFGMRLLSYSNLWQLQQGVIIGPLHQGVKTLCWALRRAELWPTDSIYMSVYNSTHKQTNRLPLLIAGSDLWMKNEYYSPSAFSHLDISYFTNKGAEKIVNVGLLQWQELCFGVTHSAYVVNDYLHFPICCALLVKLEILISLFFQVQFYCEN